MFEYLAFLEAEFPLLVYTVVLVLGLIVGSFLNVVILRLPVMMQRDWEVQAREILGIDQPVEADAAPFNLVTPNSRCPSCSRPIRPWENVPVVSYLVLGGQCAGCSAPISIRYPLIEALTGALSVMVVVIFGATPAGAACLVLTWGLISMSIIDIDHQLLPDGITLPLLWLGLIVNYFELITPFAAAFWGAVAGYLILWSVYQVFRLVTGKEGMGFGDFKLLAMLGAWLGWQALPLVIILSSFTGAVIGGLLVVFGRDRAEPIPFGPYLAIAGFIALLWGDEITSQYLRFTSFQ
ncbi:MAG: A24 family peptidase [Gammaproteobacteria bacterium]|nr:A24 family peptidase [Gammaproteobacteria bacterium]